MRVLLVEDDGELRRYLTRRLRTEGFAVDEADGLAAADDALSIYPYDCVILDRILPEGDALDHLDDWRAEGLAHPVLVMTAMKADDEVVAGLAAGAADYVTKPFHFDELIARVRAVCRRRPRWSRPEPERWADLELDRATGVVQRQGVMLPLTPKEVALLGALIDANGAVVDRRRLIERCWDSHAHLASNAINVHIHSLRRKLGDPPLIRTMRGGYKLDDPTSG